MPLHAIAILKNMAARNASLTVMARLAGDLGVFTALWMASREEATAVSMPPHTLPYATLSVQILKTITAFKLPRGHACAQTIMHRKKFDSRCLPKAGAPASNSNQIRT